jgi:transcriptional antiterminator Rof (Rho-off)
MGHTAKSSEVHCDVLDELEAAITRKQAVRVHLEDGSHRMGKPTDLVTRNHEDFLHLENHPPIKVSQIVKVEKA